MKEDFIKETLEDPSLFGGFKITSYEQSKYDKSERNIWYGKAQDRTGMTQIAWCTEGHSCTYFGKKLESNIGVEVRKDAGTRSAFNGYCYNKEQFRLLLELTW